MTFHPCVDASLTDFYQLSGAFMNFKLAFKVFARTLGNRQFARDLANWIDQPVKKLATAQAAASRPARSEAVELLATLQREGRLVDFLQEDLANYKDADIGAAVRDIHRDCRATLDRIFGIAPLRTEPENATIPLPADRDPGAWKLTGQVHEDAREGRLCHHGWKITRHEVPSWQGRDESAWVVAPAEVELG